MTDSRTAMVEHFDTILRTSNRRDFLRLSALGGMAMFLPAVVTGCGKSEVSTDPLMHANLALDTSSGPLNLIYVYAQFIADFYRRCTWSTLVPPGRTGYERILIGKIAEQKVAHMKALQKLVTTRRVSDTLLFEFKSVAFMDQTRVMNAAQTFEDLGVAAVSGLVPRFTNSQDLLLSARIASSWARHAATIRDINYVRGTVPSRTNFSADGVIDAHTGLTRSIEPEAFLAAAQPYFITSLSIG